MQARRWCFTVNNYTEDEEVYFHNLVTLYPEDVRYCVFGLEIGVQGTPHIQGYIEFFRPKRFGGVKDILTERAHIEISYGSQQQAIDYCKKDGNWFEYGAKAIQGRDQWTEIKKLVLEGDNQGIFDQYPQTYLKFRKAIDELCIKFGPQEETWDGDLQQKNLWLWGAPGVGKSKRVRDEAEGPVYSKNCNKWWDGYNGEETVIIEDMDPTRANMLALHLKLWLDRYPFLGEIKGGAMTITPRYKLVITSNYSPEACFNNPEDLEAIKRRCRVEHMVRLAN